VYVAGHENVLLIVLLLLFTSYYLIYHILHTFKSLYFTIAGNMYERMIVLYFICTHIILYFQYACEKKTNRYFYFYDRTVKKCNEKKNIMYTTTIKGTCILFIIIISWCFIFETSQGVIMCGESKKQ